MAACPDYVQEAFYRTDDGPVSDQVRESFQSTCRDIGGPCLQVRSGSFVFSVHVALFVS